MRKMHFLKIPFGFDFKFNYSDMYEYNGGQNYKNLIWELLSLLDAVLDRRVDFALICPDNVTLWQMSPVNPRYSSLLASLASVSGS